MITDSLPQVSEVTGLLMAWGGGYEALNMIGKGQIVGIGRGAIQRQVKFVSNLFGIAA